MAKQTPPKVTEDEIAEAQSMWEGFTALMRYSVYATVVILVLMAIFLI